MVETVSNNTRETQETAHADYSAFDLDGPEHKQADEEIRNAIADGLRAAMGLSAIRSQSEQVGKNPA